MLLRICLMFTMLITALSMSSCTVTSQDYRVELPCAQFIENNNNVSDVEMEVGDKIRIELCSNRATGFQWEYEVTTENVVKEEDHDFKEPEGDVVGAAGTELWTFEVVDKGITKIQMEYSQPWEGGSKAEWTYTIRVTVK